MKTNEGRLRLGLAVSLQGPWQLDVALRIAHGMHAVALSPLLCCLSTYRSDHIVPLIPSRSYLPDMARIFIRARSIYHRD